VALTASLIWLAVTSLRRPPPSSPATTE
jgi:hypothetical protein